MSLYECGGVEFVKVFALLELSEIERKINKLACLAAKKIFLAWNFFSLLIYYTFSFPLSQWCVGGSREN